MNLPIPNVSATLGILRLCSTPKMMASNLSSRVYWFRLLVVLFSSLVSTNLLCAVQFYSATTERRL